MDATVELMALARRTPGASGADLMNILNESALIAAMRGRKAVMPTDTLDACDKVLYGKERKSLQLDDKEKLNTAYHESGHTIVGLVVEHSDPIEKVTIIPRGMSIGSTHFVPEKNKLSYWKKELLDRIAVCMGGRVAEEVFVGDISSGAEADISQATALAKSMVCEWGMAEDTLGAVFYENRHDDGNYLLPGKSSKTYSEATAQTIDEEVKLLVDQGNKRAIQIVKDHREVVETMAKALIEFETLDKEDVNLILNSKWNAEEKRKKIQREKTSSGTVSSDDKTTSSESITEPSNSNGEMMSSGKPLKES